MQTPAKTILITCLNVKKGENVLIIVDSKTKKIGEKIFKEAIKITECSLRVIPIGKQNGEEPPEKVAKEMKEYDVIIAPTTMSLTHTKAIKNSKGNARSATLPGITERIMKGSLLADYDKIDNFSRKVREKLKECKEVKVATKSGSEFSFLAKGREWILDTGIIHKKGECGNLPAGEVFIAPIEGSFNGKIVVDFFEHAEEVYAKKNTVIEVVDGKVKGCSDEGSKLNKYFKEIKNARNIAEFGIGTNDKAKIIGNILQDEKVRGTVHVAFGNSSGIGGEVYSELHVDTILQKPDVFLDGKALMKNGKMLL